MYCINIVVWDVANVEHTIYRYIYIYIFYTYIYIERERDCVAVYVIYPGEPLQCENVQMCVLGV